MVDHPTVYWIVVLSLWAAGCGAGSGDVDAGPSEPAVAEIGTGVVDFETLADEQSFPLEQGSQGGHHFVVHARMRGMQPGDLGDLGGTRDEGNPSTSFRAFDADGAPVDTGFSTFELGYRESEVDAGWYEFQSGRLLVIEESRVEALDASRVRLEVEITDADGVSAVDDVWIEAYEVPFPGGPVRRPPADD